MSAKIETILVPTDFSPCSEVALVQAAALARLHGAELHLLHVMMSSHEDPYSLVYPVSNQLELFQRQDDLCRGEVENLVGRLCGADVAVHQHRERSFAVAPSILEEARRIDADMIVMGGHGRRGWRRFLLGSVAEEVVREAPCPVWTVRESTTPLRERWPHRIVVPIDFSLTARQTLKEALIRFPDAQLTLLHAWNLPGERELGNQAFYAHWRDHEVARLREALDNEVESLMRELDGIPDIELVLEPGQPCDVLHDYIKRHSPDLVMLGSRCRPHQPNPLTDMLLSEPHCDVMVCRPW